MRRREEIAAIVRSTAVASQAQLLKLLRQRGFRVTQPTLSRDLHELGLAKTPNGYVAPGDLSAPAQIKLPEEPSLPLTLQSQIGNLTEIGRHEDGFPPFQISDPVKINS